MHHAYQIPSIITRWLSTPLVYKQDKSLRLSIRCHSHCNTVPPQTQSQTMAAQSRFQASPAQCLEYKELNFGSLYLYHTQFGPKANQEDIIAPKNGLGRTIANNWEVYDGVGPGSKLVARAQGLHIEAGNWHNSFSLVFEDGRYICYLYIYIYIYILFIYKEGNHGLINYSSYLTCIGMHTLQVQGLEF